MAEHAAVNRGVVGSSPTSGADDERCELAASLPGAAVSFPAVGHKRCPGCCPPGITPPVGAFARNAGRKDGLQSCCRSCRKVWDRATYAANREAMIARTAAARAARADESRHALWQHLLGHPCPCGEADPVVLEFHHPDGDKEGEIGAMVADGYLWRTIASEIEKCEVLCANCHRRITARERGYWRAFFPSSQR